jgi:hypothetical protein
MWLFFIKGKNRSNKKTVSSYKQQLVVKQGTEQFKALAKKGLGINVALL